MFDERQYEIIFDHILRCQGVEQNTKRHPEVDVFTHLVQCGELAQKETSNKELILAAYLHDIGKLKGRPYHDTTGYRMLKGFDFIPKKTLWLIRHHLHIELFVKGKADRWFKTISDNDMGMLIRLHRFDKMARDPSWVPRFDKDKFKLIF
jgi:hypothetical protein